MTVGADADARLESGAGAEFLAGSSTSYGPPSAALDDLAWVSGTVRGLLSFCFR